MAPSTIARRTAVLIAYLTSATLGVPSEAAGHPPSTASATETTHRRISLDQAVSRALESNPSLAAVQTAVSAAEARVTQAGLLPNPEIELEAENIWGAGNLAGFDAAESTAVVSQPIPLGGDRTRRRAVAESGEILAGRDLEILKLDVTRSTTTAFYRVLTAQQRERLAHELLDLAERFARTVQARVDAGKVSPVEGTRASVEVSRTRAAAARAERELDAARVTLAATWGSAVPDFDRAVGELPSPEAPPELHRLTEFVDGMPEIRRFDDLVERQRRVVDLERARAVPDLRVRVGPRWFESTGESAWVAGVAMPIPVFDRNQGARAAAEFDLERVRREAIARRARLEAELAAMVHRLRAIAIEATAMAREIVPSAESAFEAAGIGYHEGKLGFLEVLDAQRELFELRSMSLDSREAYATARAELERLIGRPLSAVTDDVPAGHTAREGGGS